MEHGTSDYLREQAAAFRRLADAMTGPLDTAALLKLSADCDHHAELVRRHALTLEALRGVEDGRVLSHEQVLEWVEQKKTERRQQKQHEAAAPSPSDSPQP